MRCVRLMWVGLALLAGPTLGAQAEPYCRPAPFDAEQPPGLPGRYELLGRQRAGGPAYSGELEIRAGSDRFLLTRTVRGQLVRGQARVEHCSPDRFQILRVRYAQPAPLELICYLRFDGDNYMLANCRSVEGSALEAWAQRH